MVVMRKLFVTEWISLDGFTAGPNGEMDWIIADEENATYQNQVVEQADTLLLGRVTYESFAGYWGKIVEPIFRTFPCCNE